MAVSPEAYLISSILRDRDLTTAVAQGVTNTMFHAYQDEWVWIERYFSKHRKCPTKMAFMQHFPDFRMKAVNDTGHFIEEVRKSHARATLTTVMRDATDLIATGDIDKAVAMIAREGGVVAAGMGAVTDTNILTDWQTSYDDAKYRKVRFEKYGMAGIPTGFVTVDERTGGVHPGQSWIVGARIGERKSWTLMKMAATAIMAGYNVHFAALEMSRVEVSMRMHNFLSGAVGKNVFQSLALMQGKDFDLAEYREFLRSLKTHVKGQLTVSDNRRIGSVEIAAQIERHKPDIYFLDYLTLAKTKGDGGWQDIGQLSKDITIIAGEYGTAMVSAAQLNRTNGLGKDPAGTEALAQADAIGQDADAVITLKQLSESVTKMRMAKYRHGRAGYNWYTRFDMTKGIFEEVSKNTAMEIMDQDADRADAEAHKREVRHINRPAAAPKSLVKK